MDLSKKPRGFASFLSGKKSSGSKSTQPAPLSLKGLILPIVQKNRSLLYDALIQQLNDNCQSGEKKLSKINDTLQDLLMFGSVDQTALSGLLMVVNLVEDKKVLKAAFQLFDSAILKLRYDGSELRSSFAIQVGGYLDKFMKSQLLYRRVHGLRSFSYYAVDSQDEGVLIAAVEASLSMTLVSADKSSSKSKKNYFKRESKGDQKNERISAGVTIQDLGGERGIMQATGMGICRRRLPQQFNRLKDQIFACFSSENPIGAKHAMAMVQEYCLLGEENVAEVIEKILPFINIGIVSMNTMDESTLLYLAKICGTITQALGSDHENTPAFNRVLLAMLSDSSARVVLNAVENLDINAWEQAVPNLPGKTPLDLAVEKLKGLLESDNKPLQHAGCRHLCRLAEICSTKLSLIGDISTGALRPVVSIVDNLTGCTCPYVRAQALQATVWITSPEKLHTLSVKLSAESKYWSKTQMTSFLQTLRRRLKSTPGIVDFVMDLTTDWCCDQPENVSPGIIFDIFRDCIQSSKTSAELVFKSVLRILSTASIAGSSIPDICRSLIWFVGEDGQLLAASLGDGSENSLFLDIIRQLEKYCVFAPWEIRRVAAESLSKVAILTTDEILRLRIYDFMTQISRDPSLNMKTFVGPSIAILDKMYEGKLILAEMSEDDDIDKDMLKHFYDVHRALTAAINGSYRVPDGFLPLGDISRAFAALAFEIFDRP